MYIPEKQGYIFKGWYSDPRKKENQMTEFTLNEDGVVYARWEEIDTDCNEVTILTEEDYEQRLERIRSLIQELMERYFDILQRAN